MKTIEIKKEKLKLTRITTWRKGDNRIYLEPGLKNAMRIQKIVFINPSASPRKYNAFSVIGKTEMIEGMDSVKDFPEAWVLERMAEKSKRTEDYSMEEIRIINAFCASILNKHVPLVEALLQAVKNGSTLKSFYETFGTVGFERFKTELLLDYPRRRGTSKSPVSDYSPIYQRTRRYGVLDLMNDLVKDETYIMTDPELIKKYQPITRLRETGGKFIYSEWSKVISKQGNRTRANLSLVFQGKIEVEVPENEFGITPGTRQLDALRSFCIIKDGVLWTPKLGIKTDNKHLINRLKMTGCIEGTLVFENEYLLDLTKLPIVGRDFVKRMPASAILSPEINLRLAHISQAYLRRLMWMKEKGITIWPLEKENEEEETEADKFLHSLGIWGNKYYPPKTTSGDYLGFVYKSTEIVKRISGLPESFYNHLTAHINKGKASSPVIEERLREIDGELKAGKTFEELLEKYEYLEKANRERAVETNLKLIMTKNLAVEDKHRPIVDHDDYKKKILIGKNQVEVSFIVREVTDVV